MPFIRLSVVVVVMIPAVFVFVLCCWDYGNVVLMRVGEWVGGVRVILLCSGRGLWMVAFVVEVYVARVNGCFSSGCYCYLHSEPLKFTV